MLNNSQDVAKTSLRGYKLNELFPVEERTLASASYR